MTLEHGVDIISFGFKGRRAPHLHGSLLQRIIGPLYFLCQTVIYISIDCGVTGNVVSPWKLELSYDKVT